MRQYFGVLRKKHQLTLITFISRKKNLGKTVFFSFNNMLTSFPTHLRQVLKVIMNVFLVIHDCMSQLRLI